MTKPYTPGGITVTIGQRTAARLPPRVFRVRLTGFLFETDKTFLLPSAMRGIRGLVNYYRAHPEMTLVVTGHTDTVGDAAYNVALSEERAKSVAHYLKDEVDPWLACYQGSAHSKIWGTREDQHMLSAITDETGEPFYAGSIHGQLDVATRDAVTRYQTSRGLTADGQPGPETRRALCTDYMAQDGTTLPPSASLETLGCGENHPEVPTPDATDEPANRRVEVFLFDGPADPAKPGDCPGAGCAYPEWKRRAIETIDFDHVRPPSHLKLRLLDPRGRAFSSAKYRIRIEGETIAEGVATDDGWIEADVETTSDVGEVSWGTADDLERLAGAYPYKARTYLVITDEEDEMIARKRLHNLGYTPSDDGELGPALTSFQRDWNIEPATGELDEPTKTKLAAVHDGGLERA